MVQRTKIEWADYTVNPLKFEVSGESKPINLCVKCSAGCAGCYAESIGKRFNGSTYSLGVMNAAKPVIVEKDLRHILSFRPRPPFKGGRARPIVFPFDMTDLFGEWVPFELIDQFFAAFALRPDVDFVILTKRATRMAEYFEDRSFIDLVSTGRWIWKQGQSNTSPLSLLAQQMSHEDQIRDRPDSRWQIKLPEAWPLPNVWLGVSVENQAAADERIPHLLKCPAAVRFLSVEPMIGPVNLKNAMPIPLFHCPGCGNEKRSPDCEPCGSIDNTASNAIRRIDWVIVGGESGPNARPMHPAWPAAVRDQCKSAGVPFFFKQWGAWAPTQCTPGGDLGGDMRADHVRIVHNGREPDGHFRKGDALMRRASKKAAGREWCGVTIEEWPDVMEVPA